MEQPGGFRPPYAKRRGNTREIVNLVLMYVDN